MSAENRNWLLPSKVYPGLLKNRFRSNSYFKYLFDRAYSAQDFMTSLREKVDDPTFDAQKIQYRKESEAKANMARRAWGTGERPDCFRRNTVNEQAVLEGRPY